MNGREETVDAKRVWAECTVHTNTGSVKVSDSMSVFQFVWRFLIPPVWKTIRIQWLSFISCLFVFIFIYKRFSAVYDAWLRRNAVSDTCIIYAEGNLIVRTIKARFKQLTLLEKKVTCKQRLEMGRLIAITTRVCQFVTGVLPRECICEWVFLLY